MAIRIKAGDLIIEVDTGYDLREALLTLSSMDTKKHAISPGHKKFPGGVKLAQLSDHNFTQLFSSFGNTKKAEVLQALKEHPAGMTDEDLRTRMHLENNNALAGILGAISKNAVKAGFEPSQIMTKDEQKDKEGKRIYLYKLTKEMADAMSWVTTS